MPELPEVETVRRHLDAVLPGRQIADVTLQRADLRLPIPVDAMHALTEGTLGPVRRRAKYLLIDVTAPRHPPRVLLVHLGMSGRVFMDPEPPAEWRKHEHWRLRLTPALWLRYVDARRFGVLDTFAQAQEATHPLLAHLGPEPLDPAWTPAHLRAACAGRQAALKLVLMDQAHVVGIGNIYASEACWRAHLDPHRPAGKLTLRQATTLIAAAREVLLEAIAAGGSTLRDFVGGDEAPGYFQQRLDVYDRGRQPCHRCGPSALIVRTVLGGRATYHCPRCQN